MAQVTCTQLGVCRQSALHAGRPWTAWDAGVIAKVPAIQRTIPVFMLQNTKNMCIVGFIGKIPCFWRSLPLCIYHPKKLPLKKAPVCTSTLGSATMV